MTKPPTAPPKVAALASRALIGRSVLIRGQRQWGALRRMPENVGETREVRAGVLCHLRADVGDLEDDHELGARAYVSGRAGS